MQKGTKLGRYTILGRLGAGGMGEVYRAEDGDLRRQVAIKVLPAKLAEDAISMERFQREAVVLASVNHPNIAVLHGFEEDDGVRFLVMELVRGRTLSQLVRKKPLSIPEALRVGSQIAKALEAAHKRGVIHRDLKPGNVMVDDDGWVKVLDFGVAKVLQAEAIPQETTLHDREVPRSDDPSRPSDLTAAGALVGTAAYISPEQIEGREADARIDLWAFGCVLFEALTGSRAFEGPTMAATFDNILNRAPRWEALPPQTPPPVRTLLGRCLQKDPNRRLHAIADARIELEEALHPYLAPQQPAETGPPSRRPPDSTLSYLSTLGPYSVVERIGAGATAEVYRAWDRRHGLDVALKVLRPALLSDEAARAALRRESDTLSRIRHPNVVGWLDAGAADGVDYLVLEYVSGGSLASKLEGEPLPEPEVARLGSQIAAGLAAAHAAGIIHGDLKAGNVLLTQAGQAKLTDFGIALSVGRNGAAAEAAPPVRSVEASHAPADASEAADATLAENVRPAGAPPEPIDETVAQSVRPPRSPGPGGAPGPSGSSGPAPAVGPLAFRAPEVLRGQPPSVASDLYGLGVLLYRMATGELPFAQSGVTELTEAILRRPPVEPTALRPTLSAALDEVIRRCLAKRPEERYASAEEVHRVLFELIHEPGTLPPGAPGAGTGSFVTGVPPHGTAPGTANRGLGPEAASRAGVETAGSLSPGSFAGGAITGHAAMPTAGAAGGTLGDGTRVPGTEGASGGGRFSWLWAVGVAAALAVVAGLVWLGRDGGGAETAAGGFDQVDSLVVLPTRVLGEETPGYLTDAIPNSLSTMLSRIDSLDTKVPPTSEDVGRLGGGLEKVAAAYGVDYVVASSVSSEADQLVLNLQMVEAASRRLLWSDDFRADAAAYGGLIQQAAEGMREALRPGASSLSEVFRAATAAEGEVAMQQGLYYSNLYRNRGRPGDKERAIELFEKALAADPQRAEAAAEIAVLHAVSLQAGVPLLEVLPEIRTWSEKALAIDPRSSRAWAVRGQVEGGKTDESFRQKLEYSLRAATYGPRDDYAHNQLAGPLASFSPRLALEASRQASRVNPLVLTPTLFEALLLTSMSRWDEAVEQAERVLEIEPGSPFGLLTLVIALSLSDPQEALRRIETDLEPLEQQGLLLSSWVEMPREVANFGRASAAGDRAEADRAAAVLIAMARGEKPFPRWQFSTGSFPALLARHGRHEEALNLLEARRAMDMLPPYEQLLLDPHLEPIRDDSRFTALLSEARESFDRTIGLLEEVRARGELPPYLEAPLAELLGELRQAWERRRAA